MEDIDVMEGVTSAPGGAPSIDTDAPVFDADKFFGRDASSVNYSQDVTHPMNRIRFAKDASTHAVFYEATAPDLKASRREGRPIYKAVDRVKIVNPGNRSCAVDRIARVSDVDRFPRQYQAYKRGQPELAGGMPLKTWPMVTPAQVEELRYFEVHTVEQLAAVSDESISRMGRGSLDLRRQAQEWITRSAGEAQQKQSEAQQKQIADLNAQLEALRGMIGSERGEADAPKPRGRPRRKAELETETED